jgi:exosortase A
LKTETYFKPAREMPHMKRLAPAAAALAAVLALCFFYRDTLWSMVSIWLRSDTFAHGLLVVPISLWLIWRVREEIAAAVPRPWFPALLVVTGAGFGWLLADIASITSVTQFAVIVMIQATVLTVLGTEMTRRMMFPLAFLLFAAPAGEFLVPTLMNLTADFTIWAVAASGVPVYREGNQFVIPSGRWSVVEACSGIRYLIASLMAGSLYAYLQYRSYARRAAFMVAAAVVPLVANWLRAYLIVMVGHLSNNQYAAGVDHLVYGWVFFGIVILLMFWIGSFWREDGEPRTAAARYETRAALSKIPTSCVLAAVLAVVAGALWRPVDLLIESRMSAIDPSLEAVAGENGWVSSASPAIAWTPRFIAPTAQLQQTFVKGGKRVALYIAYYSRQGQGHELVNSENVLVTLKDTAWHEVSADSRLQIWNGAPLEVRTAELQSRDTRLVVRHWFWVNGTATASDYAAKALLAFAKLFAGDDDSVAIMIYTPGLESPADAQQVLDEFSADMSAVIERALQRARQR